MILLNQDGIIVHRLVVFNEYYYLLALRLGSIRQVVIRGTGKDLKSLANKMYDKTPAELSTKMPSKQVAMLGQLMREGVKCLNVS